jgi:mono/diheme cytochrome c family protein
MKASPFICAGLLLWLAAISVAEEKLPPAASRKIDYAADVAPLLKRACYECHGAEKQKSGFRLDIKKTALTGGDLYAPNILPGKSAESPLIRFVAGADEDVLMPPEGKRLTAQEVGILRAWIDQGANWPDELAGKIEDKRDWWSLKPLAKPGVPGVADPGIRNPIDAFIRERLAKEGFKPSPEADRRTLIRRLYFDLIGLPPSPEEIAAFVADKDPQAYEELVNRLLDSPRYGERWARHWMDAVHFAETHGHDQDRIRENAWPYRDYLIGAFNSDKPYGRFVEEQIAGDVLYPADPSATIALGFLAAGPWDESSLRDIREDTLDRQIGRYLDRDDMIGTVMHNLTSLTVQCARCHDHKFDPISQREYYQLQAVFSGVERANRKFDADPQTVARRKELTERKKLIDKKDAAFVAAVLANEKDKLAVWEKVALARGSAWQVVAPESFTSAEGSTLTKQDDGSVLSGGKRPEKDTYTLTIPVAPGEITGVRVEVLGDDSLPHRGPGRQDNGNLHLSEFQLFLEGKAEPLALGNPTSDFDQQDWGIAKALDGIVTTAWGVYPEVGKPHRAAFELKEPLTLKEPAKLRFVLQQLHGGGHLIGRVRLAVTSSPKPVRVSGVPDALAAVLSKPISQRTPEQQAEVALTYAREQYESDFAALPPQLAIYAAAADFEPDGSLKPPPGPRPIHILHRGDIRFPKDEVAPGALACITALKSQFEIADPKIEGQRRAALAKWLTDKQNPLIWRSIVNRIWHHHFGRGLSSTLNDFGHLGEKPSHPELLDYLADEFRDGNQSLKDLHRVLVTSATYRQTSRIVPEQRGEHSPVKTDADNRLLWRMNRTRLDAECVHDALLLASGRLDLRMGGPSDRQFDLQPGIHVTPRVDYSKFDLDSPAGRRRSVYRFLFRTLPDPWMEALDCPSGDQFMPARTNSVTVQQALALWNDAFVVRQCEHLAARVQREEPATDKQVVRLVQLALGRAPTESESRELQAYAGKHGLANLCRLLVNSNEFLFVD